MSRQAVSTCLLLCSLPLVAAPAALACDIQLGPGEGMSMDIQGAIDSAVPGDVICLDPGLYSPGAKIVVDKSLTLRGPQAGVDPRPSASTTRLAGDAASEAIIDGGAGGLSGILVIQADGVVVEGLEIRNGGGDLIDSESSIATSGTKLRYNIIHHSSGDEGVQLRRTASPEIEFNHVFATAGDGINVCCGSAQAVVRFNEVHDISSPDAAIYLYDDSPLPTDIDAIIAGNLVYDVLNNDGIQLGDKNGADSALSGGGILDNVVFDTAQDCITVYASNVLVDGNECFNSLSENGAIFLDFAIDSVLITNNDIHDNGDPEDARTTYGIRVGRSGFPTNVVVNNNSIRRNEEGLLYVFPPEAPALDAVSNYWGAPSGPSGAGPGSGDSVSENVFFTPFLISCPTGICPAGSAGESFQSTLRLILAAIADPESSAEVDKALDDKVLEKVKKAFEEFLKGHPHHLAEELKKAVEELEKIFTDRGFDTTALQADVTALTTGKLEELTSRVFTIAGPQDEDLAFAQMVLDDSLTALFANQYGQAAELAVSAADKIHSPDYLGDFCAGPAGGGYRLFACEVQSVRDQVVGLVDDDQDSDSDSKRIDEAGSKLAQALEKLVVVGVKDAAKKSREAGDKLAAVLTIDTTPQLAALTATMSGLLVEYLDDATASGHDPNDLQEAAERYVAGESARLAGDWLTALEQYEKAADKAKP